MGDDHGVLDDVVVEVVLLGGESEVADEVVGVVEDQGKQFRVGYADVGWFVKCGSVVGVHWTSPVLGLALGLDPPSGFEVDGWRVREKCPLSSDDGAYES